MKTKQEIKEWMLENCVDKEGDINLSGLDFSDFDGNVHISNMKVKNKLFQQWQKVGGNLWQSNQKVEGTLFQQLQKVGGYLEQSNQKVKGDLYQEVQKVKGDLYQYGQKVKGYAYIGRNKFTGIKEWHKEGSYFQITKEIDQYEHMSREELIKVIKELKGEE